MANIGGKGRFMIRKRAAPNILPNKSNSDSQTSTITDSKVEAKTVSSIQPCNKPENTEKNVENQCEQPLPEPQHIKQNESTSCNQNNIETASLQKDEEPEGVVRVYLNCWPQYPLDDLNDDPFFEDRNFKELGKVSVFMEKGHKVAFCDMATTLDFKDIPKNWAFVNFNKLIKEEFKEPDSEEYQNAVNSQNDEYNSATEEKQSDYYSRSSQLVCNYEDNSTCHNRVNDYKELTDVYKEPDKLSEAVQINNELNVYKNPVKRNLKSDGSTDKCKKVKSSEENIKSIECETESTYVNGKKPYTLRKAKPLSVKKYEEIDCGNSEDIFSNSDDSDISEYEGESKVKKGKIISPKKVTKTIRKTQKNLPKVKNERLEKEKKENEKKEKVKKEKQPKFSENASPFVKLGIEVKNKNKWDEDGNCAEPEKLELKDYIFYVPKNEPMSQLKKEMNTVLSDKEADEEILEQKEEENHGPKLVVKDGKIIVDPNSTKIKQTPVTQFKIPEKWEKPRETNDPWELQETMKFYATLWKYGIDFSMLAGAFPKKSRDALKKKFSYEDKNNSSLLVKTLTKKLDMKAILREVILIDSLERHKFYKKKKHLDKPAKETEKKERKQRRHRLLHPPKKGRKTVKSETNDTDNNLRHILLPVDEDEYSQDDKHRWLSENEVIISEDVDSINLKDIITFSTNLIYKDMNIVESVSFHPSAIQPVDINVTICHEPENTVDTQ